MTMIKFDVNTIFMVMPFVAMVISWIAVGMKTKNRVYWVIVAVVNVMWVAYGLHRADAAICVECSVNVALTIRGFFRS